MSEDKIDIQEKLKELNESITDKIQEEKKIMGTDLLSDDRMLQLAKETFEGKMKVNLEKMKDTYEGEISKLQQDINRYKPKKPNVEFTNGWDEKVGIEKIDLHFFIIFTKSPNPRDQCSFCNAFEEEGHLESLGNLWKMINVPKDKYRLKIWEIDQADRYLSIQMNENYTSRLTPKGLNWYYAKGLGIQKFPAYDLFIYFKSGRFERQPLHRRLQGIGKKDGKYYLFGLIESMINFFKNNFESSQLERTTYLHKKDSLYGDYQMDKIKK